MNSNYQINALKDAKKINFIDNYSNDIYYQNFLPQIQTSNNELEEKNNGDKIINEFELIQILWDDLGVSNEYKTKFEKFISNHNEEEIIQYLNFEKINLKKYKEIIIKLSKEIINRENNIKKLKEIDELIEKNYKKEKKKLNESIIKSIEKTINLLRITSVNIISYINKIQEFSSYKVIKGKYILNKMKNELLYDKNYLNKMIFDIEFIKNSNLIFYFDIIPDAKIDTFFTFFNNNFPIGNDLLKGIFEAKYILMENKLLNEIYNEKKQIFSNNKYKSSVVRNNSFNSKINNKFNNSFVESKQNKSIIHQKSLKTLNKKNLSNRKLKRIKNEKKDNLYSYKDDEKIKLLNDFIIKKEKEIEKIKKEEKKKKLKQKEEEKELKIQEQRNKLIEKEMKKYEYYEFISKRAEKIVDDLIYNNQYLIKENIIIKKIN